MPDDPEATEAREHDRGDLGDDRFAEIVRLCRDFQGSRVLLTAVELDLFTHLGGDAMTASKLAAAINADERSLELVCNALVALGLLSRDGDWYASSTAAQRYLDAQSEEYRGNVVHLANWWWTRWSMLTDVVRGGEAVDGPPEELTESFVLAMHEGKPDVGRRMVECLDLHAVTRVIDLGCGPATILEALAEALPEVALVGVDRPEVLEVARRRLPAALLEQRIVLVPGDFVAKDVPRGGELPEAYDLAILSSVVHLLDEPANIALLTRVHDALDPGGKLAIRDFVVTDGGSGPREAALFAITMLVASRAGRCYEFERIRGWLHDAGFGQVEMQDFDGPVKLITARRA